MSDVENVADAILKAASDPSELGITANPADNLSQSKIARIDSDIGAAPTAAEDSSSQPTGASGEQSATAATSSSEGLPEGWVSVTDKQTGRVFFQNKALGKISAKPPPASQVN